MGTEEQYTPKLWYYNLLLFTADQESTRESRDNMENESPDEDEENNEVSSILLGFQKYRKY